MAKLRRNHTKQSSASGGGMMAKIGIFAVVLAGLFWGYNQFSGTGGSFSDAVDQVEDMMGNEETESPAASTPTSGPKGPSEPGQMPILDDILPSSTTGQVIKHNYYALSYSEEHEQAEWVAYVLTKDELYIPNVERGSNFRPDPRVRKASASTRDYKGSGYDRGHLVPAADMAFNEQAMSETFYMSNMSPQISNFNGGVWRELEETVRDWAKKNNRLYIATGPVLTQGIREKIGGNEVSVPDLFYKVILDIDDPEDKAIGFIIPNEISTKELWAYAVSVDKVEALTGIDFFSGLVEDDLEEELERQFDMKKWPFNNKRYQARVDEWNRRR